MSAIQDAPLPAGTGKGKTPALEAQLKAPTNGAKKDQSRPPRPVSEKFPPRKEQKVTLKYFSPDAREVQVAGNFNDWQPTATPLKKAGSGEWRVDLALRSGLYEYRFVVDGQWCEDPQAASRGVNPYGGCNSILIVPLVEPAANF